PFGRGFGARSAHSWQAALDRRRRGLQSLISPRRRQTSRLNGTFWNLYTYRGEFGARCIGDEVMNTASTTSQTARDTIKDARETVREVHQAASDASAEMHGDVQKLRED